jgi:peptidoglycan LD-endopeptidase CwlK
VKTKFSIIVFLILIIKTTGMAQTQKDNYIIDARMTAVEALAGTPAPKNIAAKMKLVDITYYGYDDKLHNGQMLVNKNVTEEIEKIFDELLKMKFPIEKIVPITQYKWDDDASMYDNNTSSFNYRNVVGKKTLSKHALGYAVDINPRDNYYIKDGHISPSNGRYDKKNKGTILKNSSVVKLFASYGWNWGGDWKTLKDYQHFEKSNEYIESKEK